jgi:hypothetical protein
LELQGEKRNDPRRGSDWKMNTEYDNEERNDSEAREKDWNLG